MPGADVSIIIVNYNSWGFVIPLVKRLTGLQKKTFQIIVIDNASTLAPPSEWNDIQNAHLINFIGNKINKGYAGGINDALLLVKNEYVLIMNPDIEVPDGGIEMLCDYLKEHKSVSAVSPGIKRPCDAIPAYSPRRFPNLLTAFSELLHINDLFKHNPFASYYFYDYKEFKKPVCVETVLGAVMMFRTSVLRELNGMDSSFFLYFEETDLFKRMSDNGLKLCYLPETIFIHHHGQSSMTTSYRETTYYKSMSYYFKKHHSIISFLLVKSCIIIGAVMEITYFFLKHILKKEDKDSSKKHIINCIKRIITM